MPYTQQHTQAPSVAQALAFGQNMIGNKASSYEQDNSVSFDDIVREEHEAKSLQEQDFLRNEQADKAQVKRDEEKRIAEKEMQADDANKLDDNKDVTQASDVEDVSYDDTASAQDDSTDAQQVGSAESAQNDKNAVDDAAVADNLVVSFDSLPEAVQNFLTSLTTDKSTDTQALSVDMSGFSELTDEEKLQALSFITSSEMQDIYGLYSGEEAPIRSIEDFMARLKSQSTTSDPTALLSNLTPQQVTAIESYLSQQPSKQAGQELLNSILALQNIDPDTALSRGGPNGALAGMSKGEIIEHALNSGVMDDIASILQDLAQIIQPAQQQALPSSPLPNNSLNEQQVALASQQSAQSTRLPNLIQPAGTGSAENAALTEDGVPLIGTDPATADAEFEELISRFTSGSSRETGMVNISGNQNSAANNLGAQTSQSANGAPQTSATPSPLSALSGLTTTSGVLSVDEAIMQELGLSGNSASFVSTQAGSLTNATTASQGAGHAHPATQAIAATLHKSASSGATKAITLRLDPPELGRVEIKMNFDKDSKIKAVLTAERPETHLMMQRDQSVLEKALQDAGFDTEGALQFELAQDGQNFSQDGHHDQFHQGQSGSQTPEDEVETLETTMNWSVDSASGHVSYSLLV